MFDVILVMFDVINQAIDKTTARCFSITFKWVTSQTWYSRFYGPTRDVIWATLHVCGCGACQLSYNYSRYAKLFHYSVYSRLGNNAEYIPGEPNIDIYLRLLNIVQNIVINTDMESEYRALHSVVKYSDEFRPGRPNIELYLQMLNKVLHIDLESRI